MGRPSSFTQDAADEICDRIAGGESLRAICRDDAMPEERTVHRWLSTEEDCADPWQNAFRQQYARARAAQGEAYADRAVDEALTATDASIGRLRMDALKWAASKLAPKKYGEKVELEHSGSLKFERIERTVIDPKGV